MSIFGTILDKIFHHHGSSAPAAQESTAATPAAAPSPPPAAAPAPPPTAAPAPVDVEAVLTKLAADKGQPSDWRHSIVDLLKLLDMDSSLAARKELASELSVHVAADGSAEQNIALHKAVMQKLAENGGTVPESLRH